MLTRPLFKTFVTYLLAALSLTSCQQMPVKEESPSVNRPHPTADAVADESYFRTQKPFTNTANGFVHRQGEFANIVIPRTDQAVEEEISDPQTIWTRLRESEQLTPSSVDSVQTEIARYTGDQIHFDRMVENAEPFMYQIVEALDERNLPLFLSLVPMIESAYKPNATSNWNAAGLWQFIPSTGRHFGLKQNEWYDGRRDVTASTKAALDYLSYLYKRFDSWELALAAYNSGEATVSNAIKRNRKAQLGTDYWSLDLPPETRRYIPKLLALQSIIHDPSAYDVALPEIPDQPILTSIQLPGQIQLSKVAELSDDLETDTLKNLNAGFLRSVTSPDGPYELLVPVQIATKLESDIAELPVEERVKYHEHFVQEGESLWLIARRYDTRVAVLKSVNDISEDHLKLGKRLLIPSTGQIIEKTKAQPIAAPETIADAAPTQTISAQAKPIAKADSEIDLDNSATYTVKSGDSLWIIARRHNIHVDDILSWNNITRQTPLRLGQELKILSHRPILKAASVY